MTRSPWISSALALILALGSSGCGGGSSKSSASDESAAAREEGWKVTHVFEELGDQSLGHYHSLALLPEAGPQGETRLLVGTEHGLQIYHYDRGQGFSAQAHHPLQQNPTTETEVRAIHPAPDGTLWIASSDGVAQYDPSQDAFPFQETSAPIHDVALAKNGNLWLARARSLEFLQRVSSKVSEIPILLSDGAETSNMAGTKTPRVLARQGEETLWIGTEFGVIRLENKEQGFEFRHFFGPWYRVLGNSVDLQPGNTNLPGNRVLQVRVAEDNGQLAFCTDGGLALVDPDLKTWKIYQGMHRVMKSNPVQGIYHEEVPGAIGLPSSDIEDVAFVGPKSLFLATKAGLALVSREDPRARKPKIFGLDQGLPSEKVEALAFDSTRNILFVATRYGLAALENRGS